VIVSKQALLFEKRSKNFLSVWLRSLPGEYTAKRIEVFWFFFSKKNRFLLPLGYLV
jgi:hypothetical protein